MKLKSLHRTWFAFVLLIITNIPNAVAKPYNGSDQFIYLNTGIGMYDMAVNQQYLSQSYTGTTDATFDSSGPALKFVGGFQFDPLLGVEAGITLFDDLYMTIDGTTSNPAALISIYLAGTATGQLTQNIDVIGKLGMHFWSLDDASEENGGPDVPKESGQDFYYGLGLDMNLFGNRKRTLLLEWERYASNSLALKQSDVISLNLKFKFSP